MDPTKDQDQEKLRDKVQSKLPNLHTPPENATPLIRLTPWEKLDKEAKLEWINGVNCKEDAIRWYLKWVTKNLEAASELASLQEFRMREQPELCEKIELTEFEKKFLIGKYNY
jgi:hypothetical protein